MEGQQKQGHVTLMHVFFHACQIRVGLPGLGSVCVPHVVSFVTNADDDDYTCFGSDDHAIA